MVHSVLMRKIISLDIDNNVYNYLVEDRGRIIYLGDSLPPEYLKDDSTVELGNRALLPSFGDGHMHFSNWALIAVSYFNVREARDIREIQEIIQKYIAQNKKLKAVIAFGVSKHSVKEKRLISNGIWLGNWDLLVYIFFKTGQNV